MFDASVLARSSDPTTSHAAASQAEDLQARHQKIILDALKAHGPHGKDGIARLSGLNGVAVCRRLHELEKRGLIELTGRHVPSDSGRPEREWRLVQATS